MEKEILEVALQKSFTYSKIKRIIDMKFESAVPKGENFASTILRVRLKVVLGNGRIAKKSIILKKEKCENNVKAFSPEALIYKNIISEMVYLMDEFQDTEGPLWCNYIYYDLADSTIIMEDLKTSGFRTVNRTELLDLEHARLALRSLGRYHAMAKVLEERGLISKDDYKPFPFLYNNAFIRNLNYGGKLALVKGIKSVWGKEWAVTADKLSQITLEEYYKRMQNCGKFDDETFQCLNFGDCWSNNIMFRYNWEGMPIELRFVDFQTPHYNTPCVDVTYFMYSSLKPQVRRQNYNTLIELYHKSLVSSLDKFGYEGSMPSLEQILKNMERLAFFGLSFFISCFPVVTSTRQDAVDFDKVSKSNGTEGINLSIFSEGNIQEKMAEDIRTFVEMCS